MKQTFTSVSKIRLTSPCSTYGASNTYETLLVERKIKQAVFAVYSKILRAEEEIPLNLISFFVKINISL